MPRRRALFTEAEARRAIKAGRKEAAERVEITRDGVTVAYVLGKDNGDSGGNGVRTLPKKPVRLI
jgi:hypothetical protein